MKPRPGELFMYPKLKLLPFIGGKFIPSKKYANRLEGKPSCGSILRGMCFIDCCLSQVIHLAVELSLSLEVAISPPIILVSLDVGVVPCKC
jgi:hypothetical protein